MQFLFGELRRNQLAEIGQSAQSPRCASAKTPISARRNAISAMISRGKFRPFVAPPAEGPGKTAGLIGRSDCRQRLVFSATAMGACSSGTRNEMSNEKHAGIRTGGNIPPQGNRGQHRTRLQRTGFSVFFIPAPSPLWRLAFPPADRDQHAREAKHAPKKAGHVSVGRKERDGNG